MSDPARAVPDPAPQCPIIRPSPIGSTISTTPIRAGPKIRFRSGTNCGRHRRWCTPIASSAATCRPPMRRSRQIAHDTEHFSSRRVIVRDVRPEIARNAAPPITSDPPEHKPAKQLLLPPFTPDAMKKLEPRVRAICNELIDEFIADGKCDAAARYTKHIPVRAIAHMLGIPEKDGDLFIKWIHDDPRARHQGRTHADAGGPGDDRLFRRPYRAAQAAPDRRPDLDADERQGQERPAAGRFPCAGLAAAAADRRHRHHLERDRLLAVAPGEDAGGSRAPGRGAGTDADRGRGIAARLFAGDDGARGDEGNRRSAAARSSPATWCCCRSPPPTAIPPCSPTPTRS